MGDERQLQQEERAEGDDEPAQIGPQRTRSRRSPADTVRVIPAGRTSLA
jgi:hypothetical protein